MNFIFDEFYLPKGAKLYFYNSDRTDVLGAYTHSQNRKDKIFGSWLIDGDDIFIEYFEPADQIGQGKLHMSRAVHGYRSVSDFAKQNKTLNESGPCNLDVDCPIGSDFDDKKDQLKKSVGLTIANGNGFCSGALINNTNSDGKPYFLTANHCLNANVANWAFRFNWRSPNPQCATTNGSTNGTSNQTISGANLLASNSGSDFALLEITAPIPNDWDLVWAGWDRNSTPADFVVGIHHPSGDIMKVCRDDDRPYTSVQSGAQVWFLDEWETGVTEPGSSGSPLFNQDGRIVGQLFGGAAACNGTSNNQQYDFYGRFDVSWNNGSSNTTRLRDWLDPNNTGVTTLDQYPSLVTYDVDALLTITNVPEETCSETEIQPTFIIKNNGNNPITSVDLSYQLNNETEVKLNWTGNLLNGQSETIVSPTIALSDSQNSLKASLSMPNGVEDQFPDNNNSTFRIQKTEAFETETINLELITDDYGSETTWVFEDENGDVVAEGGPYNDDVNLTVNESFRVNPNSCYTFTIFDNYGDGICCEFGSGSYTLSTAEGIEIISGSSFGSQETMRFQVTRNLGIEEFNPKAFKIFPNPTKNQINVVSNFNNLSFEVFDINGKRLIKTLNKVINLTKLSRGIYLLKIKNAQDNSYLTKKIIKE